MFFSSPSFLFSRFLLPSPSLLFVCPSVCISVCLSIFCAYFPRVDVEAHLSYETLTKHDKFTFTFLETPKQVSDQKIDLLFVVDSSDSVGRTNFLKSKEFVKAFVRAFQVSPDKTHVALIRFGNTADLSIRFGEHSSIRDFNRAVDNVAFVGGTKRLDKALVLAARVLPKARPSSKKIAIIISDGKQTQGPGVEPLDFAAQPLHGIGANVYVIGTGQQVDIPKLQKITQKPGDLFVSRSYDDLLQQILYLIRHMTKGKWLAFDR